jgi:hypothetical protein
VQTVRARCLILALMFAPTAWLVGAMQPVGAAAARWPVEAALYAVPGWQVGPLSVERANGYTYATRVLGRPDAPPVRLTITTDTSGKGIYRAGPGVPYLGSGYTVEAPPSTLQAALGPGEGALVARSGSNQWFDVHAYGERRGLLGNGPAAWGWLGLDLLLGRPNDYYLVRLVTTYAADDPASAQATVALANELLPRIAAWYAG